LDADAGGMTTILSSVTVERPSVAVFDYLVDPANQVYWSPNFQALEQPPDGPLGLGSRFRGRLKNFGSLEFVYDEFEASRRFRMATDHRTGHMTHRFTVQDEGNSTRVEHEVGFEARGLARFASPLMKPMLARMIADLDRLLKSTLDALPPR
jgi:uncharacterized protein YndB with AHSA1/START domain